MMKSLDPARLAAAAARDSFVVRAATCKGKPRHARSRETQSLSLQKPYSPKTPTTPKAPHNSLTYILQAALLAAGDRQTGELSATRTFWRHCLEEQAIWQGRHRKRYLPHSTACKVPVVTRRGRAQEAF